MRRLLLAFGVLFLAGCSSQPGLLSPDRLGLPYEQTLYSSSQEFELADSVSSDCSGEIRQLERELNQNSIFLEGQSLSKPQGTEGGVWLFTQYIFNFPTESAAEEFAIRYGSTAFDCDKKPGTEMADELLGSSQGLAWKATATSEFLGVKMTLNSANAVVAKGSQLFIVSAWGEEAALSFEVAQEAISKALN